MWGDDCALCGGPVGGNPIMVEGKDGAPMGLCSACAMRFGGEYQSLDTARETGHSTAGAADRANTGQDTSLDVGGAAGLMTRMADARDKEAAQLRSLARLMEHVNGEMLALQDTLEERGARIHALEAEVNRLQERLRTTEQALAPAFAGDSPAQPSVVPAVAENGPWDAAPRETARAGTETPTEAEPYAEPTAGPPVESEAPLASIRDRWGKAGLSGDDVHLVQRYFAESIHTEKTRAVRRSLGKPIVNLHPVAGESPRVMITIAWEIVWYQFLVDLMDGLPDDRRVQAFAEGMELSELAPQFLEDNAALDQDGRVDASELELSLLANPPELLTELAPERATELEDATEEIWDKRSQPEFRWDD